jgi:DNA-binding GntR family transcriptional regulator
MFDVKPIIRDSQLNNIRKYARIGLAMGKSYLDEMKPPIETGIYRTKVYAYLREKIISGELLPGETITLRGLAALLGVNVSPIREALVQLESEKVILHRANRDYRVNTLSRSQFDEIFKVRRMLEPYLGDLACRKRPDSAVAEAVRILKNMQDARNDAKRFISLNHDFHFYLYSFAESPILLDIVSGLWARIGPYFTINLRNLDLQQNLDLHSAMIASFTRMDPKGFNGELLADMKFSYANLAPFIKGTAEEDDSLVSDPPALLPR